MGIGRQTALKFARNRNSTIIIMDIRDDLKDTIINEINLAGNCHIYTNQVVWDIFTNVIFLTPKA